MISILVAAAVGLAVTLLGTPAAIRAFRVRSEEHTSELQSR